MRNSFKDLPCVLQCSPWNYKRVYWPVDSYEAKNSDRLNHYTNMMWALAIVWGAFYINGVSEVEFSLVFKRPIFHPTGRYFILRIIVISGGVLNVIWMPEKWAKHYITKGCRVGFLWVKRRGRDAEHPPPSSPGVERDRIMSAYTGTALPLPWYRFWIYDLCLVFIRSFHQNCSR